MNSLPEAIPDPDDLLSLEVDELASLVPMFAQKQISGGMLHQPPISSALQIRGAIELRFCCGHERCHDRTRRAVLLSR
jgi:hypothetical protein